MSLRASLVLRNTSQGVRDDAIALSTTCASGEPFDSDLLIVAKADRLVQIKLRDGEVVDAPLSATPDRATCRWILSAELGSCLVHWSRVTLICPARSNLEDRLSMTACLRVCCCLAGAGVAVIELSRAFVSVINRMLPSDRKTPATDGFTCSQPSPSPEY